MFSPIAAIRKTRIFRLFSFLITFMLITGLVMPPAQAAMMSDLLPQPGQILALSAPYRPAILRGITINPDNPFLFDFLLQRGDAPLKGAELKTESEKLIKYFLTALTVPEDEGWVNLSPYEKDQIIAEPLSATQMGRTMLEQDYTLKQLSASLTYPETELGQAFWRRVQDMAFKKFGTRDISIDNFNKVWIVPERAVVTEQGATAFVVDWNLKVMMEADYQALKGAQPGSENASAPTVDDQTADGQELSARFVREIVVPELEKEVNAGTHFAPIRQVFLSVILATWFKQRLQESLLGKVYVDQNKTAGVDTEDPAIKQAIYDQYLAAFQQGVYNLVREDYDADAQAMIPRKYFSGGMTTMMSSPLKIMPAQAIVSSAIRQAGQPDDYARITVLTEESQPAADAGIAALFVQGHEAGEGAIDRADVITINGQEFSAVEALPVMERLGQSARIVEVKLSADGKKKGKMVSLSSTDEEMSSNPELVDALIQDLARSLDLVLIPGRIETGDPRRIFTTVHSGVAVPGWSLMNMFSSRSNPEHILNLVRWDLKGWEDAAKRIIINIIKRGWSAPESSAGGYAIETGIPSLYDFSPVYVVMTGPGMAREALSYDESRRMRPGEVVRAFQMLHSAVKSTPQPGAARDRFAHKFVDLRASLVVDPSEVIEINGRDYNARVVFRVLRQMQRDLSLFTGTQIGTKQPSEVLGLVRPFSTANYWTEQELAIAGALLTMWAKKYDLKVRQVNSADSPSDDGVQLRWGLGGGTDSPEDWQAAQASVENEIASLTDRLQDLPSQSSPVAKTASRRVAAARPAVDPAVFDLKTMRDVITLIQRELRLVEGIRAGKSYVGIGVLPQSPSVSVSPAARTMVWALMDEWNKRFDLEVAFLQLVDEDGFTETDQWWALAKPKKQIHWKRLAEVQDAISKDLIDRLKNLGLTPGSSPILLGAQMDGQPFSRQKDLETTENVQDPPGPVGGDLLLAEGGNQVMWYIGQVEDIIADPNADGKLYEFAGIRKKAKRELDEGVWGAFNKISMGLYWWRLTLMEIRNPESSDALDSEEVLADRFSAIRAAFSAEDELLSDLADERTRLVEKWQERMAMMAAALEGLSAERSGQAQAIGDHVIGFQQELADEARTALSAPASSPVGPTGAVRGDWSGELIVGAIEETWAMIQKSLKTGTPSLKDLQAGIEVLDSRTIVIGGGVFQQITNGLFDGARMVQVLKEQGALDHADIVKYFAAMQASFAAEQELFQGAVQGQVGLKKWADLMWQLRDVSDSLPEEQFSTRLLIDRQVATFYSEVEAALNAATGIPEEPVMVDESSIPDFLPEAQPLSSPVAPGGIDFDPRNMDLQIRRDAHGVPLPLPMQDLEQIHIDGLYPVILNIAPANLQGLPFLLGLLADQDPPLLAREVSPQDS